jgi:hypothetical protein
MSDNDPPPPPAKDDRDVWFDVDGDTHQITFRKDHPTYLRTRSEFAALGYDLDACQTATDIFEIRRRHLAFFSQLLDARMAALVPKNLEEQLIKAIYERDGKERERLTKLLKKRKALGLNSIK